MKPKRRNINFSLEFPEGEGFDGPLDLLLFLIKRNEVDIYDLPVSLITSQYLEYLRYMQSFNLDIAGDFLVMAATLAQIKSRMLLPGPKEEGALPGEDPRLELVRPLIEYQRVQKAAEALGSRYILDRDVFTRGEFDDFPDDGEPVGEPLFPSQKYSLFELVEAWRGIAAKPKAQGQGLSFRLETVTIAERLRQIRESLISGRSLHFTELKGLVEGPLEASLSFLAILELARTGFLRLWQDTEDDPTGPRLFLADPGADSPENPDYK
ncbi:MAG: segregation/condensation protein A [Deltaproteobacteria bacterium]|nr:segregation/condensation protein A [Deltaproteobacteria bacterium]